MVSLKKKQPVVMLIEDNCGDALLVQDALRTCGFDCAFVCVENAVQAYRYLQARAPYEAFARPDLIILDLNLPVISGSEFLREIRGSKEWRGIPVIVFSSSRRESDIREVIELGAVRYLPKPPVWSGYVDAAREIHKEWHSFAEGAA